MTLRARDRRYRQLIRHMRDEVDHLHSGNPRRTGIASRSVGALALGAMAIGALAIGALAIGKLAIGRARIRRLEIDELVVRNLDVLDELHVPSKEDAER